MLQAGTQRHNHNILAVEKVAAVVQLVTLKPYDSNSLPSRFGQLVETRLRHGLLRMVFPGVCPFRVLIWCPSGGWRHARGREHCRGEPGSAPSGGYVPDSAKAEGSSITDEQGEG